ncbi:Imm50 family immunity protein [Pseudomonas sp. PB3P13]
MKYWNELDGSAFFCMVFSGRVLIDEIKLFSIVVDNNQSVVTLAFDIRDLPDKPPKKWVLNEYNACRIGISCSEFEGLMIKNLPTDEIFRLSIAKKNSRTVVSATSASSSINFTASFLTLRDPSVYLTRVPF